MSFSWSSQCGCEPGASSVSTLQSARERIRTRCTAEQLLHGEPQTGNLLNTRVGLMFIDFEINDAVARAEHHDSEYTTPALHPNGHRGLEVSRASITREETMPQSYSGVRAAVVLVAASGLLLVAAACTNPGRGPSLSGSPLGSSPGSVPASAPASVPPTTSVSTASAPCTAAAIEVVSALEQGAMGTAAVTVTVRNGGELACTLTGAPPLRYVTDGGANAAVPAEYAQDGGPVAVQPGGQAFFNVSWPNGYAGFQPGSPQCAHPAQYGHLSAILNDESVLPLSDVSPVGGGPTSFVIAIQCGSILVASWTVPSK
jgi:hypothetical protein